MYNVRKRGRREGEKEGGGRGRDGREKRGEKEKGGKDEVTFLIENVSLGPPMLPPKGKEPVLEP